MIKTTKNKAKTKYYMMGAAITVGMLSASSDAHALAGNNTTNFIVGRFRYHEN